MDDSKTKELSLSEKFIRAGMYTGVGTVIAGFSTSVVSMFGMIATSGAPYGSTMYSLTPMFESVGKGSLGVAMATAAIGGVALGGNMIYDAIKNLNAPETIDKTENAPDEENEAQENRSLVSNSAALTAVTLILATLGR